MGALHPDTHWPSEEEGVKEITSVSVDRYYLTLVSAICSYPHMFVAVLLTLFSLRKDNRALRASVSHPRCVAVPLLQTAPGNQR